MGMGDFSLLSALKSKMFWHESRQRLLAENVANADTPGYRVRDLAKPDFAQMASAASTGSAKLKPTASVTHAAHFSTSMSPVRNSLMTTTTEGAVEVTPQGNGVVLEEEMMKVTSNQMDYQAAASLYSKTLGLFRTAIGR
jgi:flagellar basal-body rod protein FlgB